MVFFNFPFSQSNIDIPTIADNEARQDARQIEAPCTAEFSWLPTFAVEDGLIHFVFPYPTRLHRTMVAPVLYPETHLMYFANMVEPGRRSRGKNSGKCKSLMDLKLRTYARGLRH
jgi:hypothetical protein